MERRDRDMIASTGIQSLEAFVMSQRKELPLVHSKQAQTDFVKLAVMDGLATVRNAKILKD